MNGIERMTRQLNHQSVDRIAVSEEFWGLTVPHWVAEGKMKQGESVIDHFNMDMDTLWTFDYTLHPDEKDIVLEEDEDTRLVLNRNHAKLRTHKKHASTPEHLGYEISDKADWERLGKPFLTPDRRRINFNGYRQRKAHCKEKGRFFCWSGVPTFENMHPIAGHENMLIGMAMEPEWIIDMSNTYADLNINLMEILFAEEGKPDGIWLYEDMGFRQHPFMSPQMYRELLLPGHKKIIDYCHGLGLKVIMHSCGYIEPLLPGMIEAGIDCLEAMEVKAGMDLLRIYKEYGEKIALMGGLDVRPVASNDIDGIRRELDSKIPFVKQNYGFILHTDHSVPESTNYDSYRFFVDYGLKLGTY